MVWILRIRRAMPLPHWSNSSGDDLERQFRTVRRRWIPAGAGTPKYENPELRFYTANSHGGFCHAHARPQRGTSPSPRVVFDRATLALGRLSPISRLTFCRAGFVRGFPPARE